MYNSFDQVVDKERRRWKVRLYFNLFGLDLLHLKKNISKVFSHEKSKFSCCIHTDASAVQASKVKFAVSY